jgi:hypothetical protein
MNTAQHTPSPWTHTPSREHSNPNTTRRDIVAESQFGPVFIAGDVSRSDAAVIAAAPDLLFALEACMENMEGMLGLSDFGSPTEGDFPLAIVRAAIAKARGESK